MMRRLMMAFGLLVLCSTAAMAGPFYIGASAAKTNLKVDELGDSFDSSDTTYKAFAGFRFFKFFGLEGGYVDFGNQNDTTSGIDLSVDATAWDLFAVGVLPLGKHFELFGKFGYFRWDRNAEASGAVTDSDSSSGNNPVYGAGMAFVFGKHFAVRLEYEKYQMSDVDDLNQESAGLELRF
ncbi:MAG TPA: outer membrane beta-barrel protein [Patescibacteria group bacterium]|nr:outer membrane beta-barrel protein [Patescibacteria group bacterium]